MKDDPSWFGTLKQYFNNISDYHLDNAGKNKKTFQAFIGNKFGIIPKYTARETTQHNGTVERAFSALYGRVRSLLNNAGFDPTRRARLWAEAASTTMKLDNISIRIIFWLSYQVQFPSPYLWRDQ